MVDIIIDIIYGLVLIALLWRVCIPKNHKESMCDWCSTPNQYVKFIICYGYAPKYCPKCRHRISGWIQLSYDQLLMMNGKTVWCDWINGWGRVVVDDDDNVAFVYSDGSSNDFNELCTCLGACGTDFKAYCCSNGE